MIIKNFQPKLILIIAVLLIFVLVLIFLYSSKKSTYQLTTPKSWKITKNDVSTTYTNQKSSLEIKTFTPINTTFEYFKDQCTQKQKDDQGSNLSFGSTTFRGRSGYKCSYQNPQGQTVSIFSIPNLNQKQYFNIIQKYPQNDQQEILKSNSLINQLVLTD